MRALLDGVVVAKSESSLVMYETYLPSQIYFPKSAFADGVLEPSDYRTFCPFKGTTQHWHLKLDGRTVENAAWSYEAPLHEGEAVGGYLAIYPHLVEIETQDQALPEEQTDEAADNPIVNWLLQSAWMCETAVDLTTQFVETLRQLGLPLWRLNINIWTLHPELAGQRYTWWRGGNGVVATDSPYGLLQQPAYLNSPVRMVTEGLGGVRQRLDVDDPEFQFPILNELRANGGTDYVAMPLPFSDGQIATLTLATDDADGFSTAQLGQVFEAVFVLSRHYEVLTLRRNTQDLFDTYLGQRTGQKILAGSIHRGDGEDIRAAILYCDLRSSTSLAISLEREAYLDLLNDFFERAVEPIHDHGGEVLKFIGDAVLAIFPVEDESEQTTGEVCREARAAAEEIVARVAKAPARADHPPVQCAIGLHFGDVMYGNVGAPNRLDFTVIGTAANVAARLSAYCKTIEQSFVLSGEVAREAPEGLSSRGIQNLRDVSGDVEIFVVGEGGVD